MKKLLIVLVAVLLLVLAACAVILYRSRTAPAQQSHSPGVSFPDAQQQGGTGAPAHGSFLDSPDVTPDPYNPGYYDIAPASEKGNDNAPFSVRYIAETKYFNVVLQQEPIGETRRAAETYLMRLLGLTQEQMCDLDYAVYTPNDVNSQYSGMNLGFSFCPGAVKLPQ